MLSAVKNIFKKENIPVLMVVAFVLAGIVCTIVHSKESFVSLDTGRDEEENDDDKEPSTFKTIANEAMRVRERMVDKTKARYKKFCRDNNI
tara:strand:- start:8 stop:280 length:273 start_codon:yes stop_codon:yes gene_type:complete